MPIPIAHINAEQAQALDTSAWENLTLKSGWQATSGHTPQISRAGGLIFITGAVTRVAGGSFGYMLTVPAWARPKATQFIGSTTDNLGQTYEAYISSDGTLSVQGYTNAGPKPGYVVPLAFTFCLVK